MNILIFALSVAAMALAEDTTDAEKLLVKANDQFTAKMFTEVLKEHPGESVVLSAYSVLSPLAQFSLAAVGESHDEIIQTMGMPNDNATKEVFRVVKSKLRSIKGVDLKTANIVYVANTYELNPQFESDSRDIFGSAVKNVDFSKNVDAANEINTWVEDQTNHRIKDLVTPDNFDSNTRAVLVNAIYFKGSWKDKFNAAYTTDRDFHVSKDKTIQVPTMHRKGNYLYGESADLNAKMIEIFYDGEESSLMIILPNDIDGINALAEKVKDPEVVTKAAQDMYPTEVDLFMPKFKIETQTNLKSALIEMGIKKLFESSSARLDHLLKNLSDLYITDAIQKAFIEVNEEGAEAAAANEFGVAYLSAIITETPIFKADRPFLFFLRDGQVTLFNGAYQPR